MKPILFLDVDGPLNPYAAKPHRRPEGYSTHRFNPLTSDGVTRWTVHHKHPLRVWLNPSHGPALLELGFDLVWATSWEAEANEWIGPHIGLPELPYVSFNRRPSAFPHNSGRTALDTSPGPGSTYFKTDQLVRWAAGRPFVWVDDEITLTDTDWVTKHTNGCGLTMLVSPQVGLISEDFIRLAQMRLFLKSPSSQILPW